MRVEPTSVESANVKLSDLTADFTVTATTLSSLSTPDTAAVSLTSSSLTQFRPYYIAGTAAGYVAFNSEL